MSLVPSLRYPIILGLLGEGPLPVGARAYRAGGALARRHLLRGGIGRNALVRRWYSAYSGRRLPMLRSRSATPDTRSSRNVIKTGESAVIHPNGGASATAKRPQR